MDMKAIFICSALLVAASFVGSAENKIAGGTDLIGQRTIIVTADPVATEATIGILIMERGDVTNYKEPRILGGKRIDMTLMAGREKYESALIRMDDPHGCLVLWNDTCVIAGTKMVIE